MNPRNLYLILTSTHFVLCSKQDRQPDSNNQFTSSQFYQASAFENERRAKLAGNPNALDSAECRPAEIRECFAEVQKNY
jgi:hypothetical protein